MEELREIIRPQDRFMILGEGKTKAGGSTINLLVPWTQADEKTINGRLYSKPLLQREVDRIQKAVESGAFIGTGDHPKSGLSDIATASHLVKKIWLGEGGRGWAQIKVLDTDRGRNIQSLIKAGARLGISTRGFGTTGKNGQVLDDFKLTGIDIVLNPSVKSATFTQANIFESVNFEEEVKKTKKVKINERAIESLLKLMYATQVDELGFDGSFEDFAKQKRTLVAAEYILQDYPGRFKNIEEALTYLGVPELAEKYSAEESQRTEPYTVAEVSYEAYEAGINPKEFADKLNENLKVTAALKAAGITKEERFLMAEMREAGYVGTPQELLEKCRKIQQAQKIFKPELTEEQKKVEELKKMRQAKEARRQRIIFEVNRDVTNAGGTSQEKLKEMVRKALKEEGLEE